MSVALWAHAACIWEACADKAGNVSRRHDFADTTLAMAFSVLSQVCDSAGRVLTVSGGGPAFCMAAPACINIEICENFRKPSPPTRASSPTMTRTYRRKRPPRRPGGGTLAAAGGNECEGSTGAGTGWIRSALGREELAG